MPPKYRVDDYDKEMPKYSSGGIGGNDTSVALGGRQHGIPSEYLHAVKLGHSLMVSLCTGSAQRSGFFGKDVSPVTL
jgi:hypothetical protein